MTTETLQHQALLDKCRNFTKAEEAKAGGYYPYFKPISESEDTVVVIEGKPRVMLGSNNYLGLTHHPKVLEAAQRALHRYGAGCTGSRFLNGTIDLHLQLEEALARFLKKEAAMVFSTGYGANLGLVSGLVGRGDTVFLDKLDHACIVDGARLSYGETQRFNHGDYKGLARLLDKHESGAGALVIVDGVYSMEGTIADVPELVRLCKKHGAVLAVDDAHSLGVLGPRGDGTGHHFGLQDDVDLVAGTFSKSLASVGGFVAGTANTIEYLRHHSRPFIFTASLPPANTAGVLAALEVLQEEPERRDNLWKVTQRLQDGLRGMGYDIGETKTPIVPVLIGAMDKTFIFWRMLFEAGVFTNPVVAPAVPPSQCRLRTSLIATHTEAQIDQALEAFHTIGKQLGVI
ncbi:MAG TPA: aminotransferase class I/II-fold pyridoxal phosphate-dependent enzyme [Gemmatimonadales bacterium]|nr:aminotransferase class I/II-fold pyridoxal phosphate-dependent enzyme [Gemmatimonadales bacterium]